MSLERLSNWIAGFRAIEGARINHWAPVATFALAVAVGAPKLLGSPAAPHFAPAPPPVQALPAHRMQQPERHALPNPAQSAHSVSLASLGPGRIGAAWFAGSREGADDVAIYFASFDGRAWSEPRALVTRPQLQHDTQRLIRKIGNPVLWSDGRGSLHLWFVSVSFGGWAGSALNHVESHDGGLSWTAAQRLVTSPFWNISTLVRNPPVALGDGSVDLPIYHEFIAKRPEWLRLSATGKPLDKLRLPGAQRSLQPAVAIQDSHRALMLLRDGSPAHRIRASRTEDGGRHWSPAAATELPNPDAGIALLALSNGRLLLAYNPQESNRTLLALSVSADQGQSWSPPRLIESGSGQDEFSYPSLLQDDEGYIHLAYTWQREHIEHLRFHPDWLKGMN
ncbi:MAG TPA: sialidase family protein [Rhodocyclaceae bacterium]|nr:sialidase family protein [Rhodocyclaceae bacterium]